MKRGLLETFFCETSLSSIANLAQSVAVAPSVVGKNAPANLGINVIHTELMQIYQERLHDYG